MARKQLPTDDPRVSDPVSLPGKQITDEELLAALEDTKTKPKPTPIRSEYLEFQYQGNPDSMLSTPADSTFGKPPQIKDSNPPQNDQFYADSPTQDDIQSLLNELQASQDQQRKRQGHARAQAYAINAGEAIRSGFLQDKPNYVDVPEKYDVAKGTKEKLDLGDKLKNTQLHWKNAAEERNLKKLLGEEGNETKKTIAEGANETKKTIEQKKEERDVAKTNQLEGGRKERTEMIVKGGLGRTALGINAQAGQQGARADAEAANRQAERQVPGYDQIKFNSATDQTKAADLAGSNKAIHDVGNEAIRVMRKYGPNFPKSTEWQKLESSMMNINQELTKLHQNGVMNFKDKENNDVEIGEPQKFIQYIQQNGPDVLEHALKNLDMSVDAKMYHHGYTRNPNWKEKKPSEYLQDTSGGGSSRTGVDPNAAKGLADWATGHGDFPQINNPAKDVKTPVGLPARKDSGPRKFHWDSQKRQMLDQNGQPL